MTLSASAGSFSSSVPPQLLVRLTGAATVMAPGLVGNTSVNATAVRSTLPGLPRVSVSVLVAPARIDEGENDLLAVGEAMPITRSALAAEGLLTPCAVARAPAAMVLV